MTLIEVVVVIVIVALLASGLTFSLGALTKTTLKAGAAKIAAAARYAHYRAIVNGTTIRLVFDVPGNTFSLEEANNRVTLARKEDERRKDSTDEEGEEVVAVDPWAAAKARVEQAVKPTFGASPFSPLTSSTGATMTRYQNVTLGRRVQIVKLMVPHQPAPVDSGKGAVHFFPGGMTEHAVVQLSDGSDAVYTVEIHPLTGNSKIYPREYEPEHLLGDPENPDDRGEVDQ